MRSLLIIGCLFIMILPLSSQDYVPFPESNAVWFETYSWQWSPFGYNGAGRTYFSGDTIINDFIYHKIENVRVDIFNTAITITDPEYKGAVREVLTEKKIYIILPGYENEYLFFDYTLEIGDSLSYSYYAGIAGTPNPKVIEIDTIVTHDGISRRVWHFTKDGDWWQGEWSTVIEGIGGEFGLMNGIGNCFEGCDELVCFYTDDNVVWNHPYIPDCHIMNDIGLSVKEEELSDIEIFPNPVHSNYPISISIPSVKQSNTYKAEIINLLGKIIQTILIKNEKTTISSPIVPGIYFLLISDQELNLFCRKIIVK